MMGYYKISLLGREVLPADYTRWHGVLSMDPADPPLSYQTMWPSHTRVPWDTKPGKQVLVSVAWRAKAEVEAMGGKDILHKKMSDVEDQFFPGMRDAVEAEKTIERGGMWYSQVLKTDKLKRRSESVEALWYVGHGSTPIRGIYSEAAASAGILGARDIAVALGQ